MHGNFVSWCEIGKGGELLTKFGVRKSVHLLLFAFLRSSSSSSLVWVIHKLKLVWAWWELHTTQHSAFMKLSHINEKCSSIMSMESLSNMKLSEKWLKRPTAAVNLSHSSWVAQIPCQSYKQKYTILNFHTIMRQFKERLEVSKYR